MERRPPAAEDWKTVSRKRSGKEWRESSKHGGNGKQVTKFFMANLPDNCSKKEISDALEGYVSIDSIYIAKKRNAMGQVFGFVSFIDVYDGLELQRKIGRVSIGGNKIKANVAKYAVENFDQRFAHLKREKREFNSQPKADVRSSGINVDACSFGGGSYRDKLLNVKCQDLGGLTLKDKHVIKVNDNVESFKDLYGRAVVGKVTSFEVLRNLKSLMMEKLWDGFEVVYVGGFYLLIVFEEEGKAKAFRNAEGWESWFHDLEVWKGQTFPFEKLAWVNVVGVPLHLVGKEVFDLIGGKFGEVVHHANPQIEDGDLSVGCMGILRKEGSIISEEVKLDWKGLRFSVWIKEGGRLGSRMVLGRWIAGLRKMIVSLRRR